MTTCLVGVISDTHGLVRAFALGPQSESLPREVGFLNLANWKGPGAGLLQKLLDNQ
jgi:hypothetical protein